MTTPTHTSSIPAGGITTQHVDGDYADYNAGRTLQQRVLISVVQAGGIASNNTKKGRTKAVKYEDLHLVEVTDPHEASRLRHLITQLQADRGLRAKQPALFDLTDAEQRESLIDMIFQHASEKAIERKALDKQFVDYFGGKENATSETVQACQSVLQLKEFAYYIGAIAETPDDDGDPTDDGAEPEPATDSTE
jgi:hypothetical protein